MTKSSEVTLDRVELAMEKLAWVISESRNPHLGTPVWQRLEQGRAEIMEHQRVQAAVKLFLKRRRQTRPAA